LNGRIYNALDGEDAWKYNYSSHAHSERNVFDSLVKWKTESVRVDSSVWDDLHEYIWKNPNSIDILYPATQSSSNSRYISIIMDNNPWISIEEAENLLKEKYCRTKVVNLPNDKWELEETTIYLVDVDKFIEGELKMKMSKE
jgi:hypothetical protein